jgi:hypothetical protein
MALSFSDLSPSNQQHQKLMTHREQLMNELILSEKSFVEVLVILVQVGPVVYRCVRNACAAGMLYYVE